MAPHTSTPAKEIRHLCSCCQKMVGSRSKALQCDHCDRWVHLTCDQKVPLALYELLQMLPENPLIYPCPRCRSKGSPPPDTRSVLTDSPATPTTGRKHSSPRIQQAANPSFNGPNEKHKDTAAQDSLPACPTVTQHNKNASSSPPRSSPTPRAPTEGSEPLVERLIPTQTVKPDTARQITGGNSSMLTLAPDLRPVSMKSAGTMTYPALSATRPSPKTLIILNWPESAARSLPQRELDENSRWKELCTRLNLVHSGQAKITRISGVRRDAPRPVRIQLERSEDIEQIITTANAVRLPTDPVRILPDLPWAERKKRQLAREADPQLDQSRLRSIIIRGMPEANLTETLYRHLHDLEQWTYVKAKLGLSSDDVRATTITRLPRPPHLSWLPSPRLMRVTLATDQMADTTLDKWECSHHVLPTDIRIHRDRPRSIRQAARSARIIGSPVVQLTPMQTNGSSVKPTTDALLPVSTQHPPTLLPIIPPSPDNSREKPKND